MIVIEQQVYAKWIYILRKEGPHLLVSLND